MSAFLFLLYGKHYKYFFYFEYFYLIMNRKCLTLFIYQYLIF